MAWLFDLINACIVETILGKSNPSEALVEPSEEPSEEPQRLVVFFRVDRVLNLVNIKLLEVQTRSAELALTAVVAFGDD